ncbi:hypothetical protein G6F46_011362 [Rhizopus delemar]|uniref:SCA7 domain-containing protein n=2 Tax=Rhizopus TaxID=4842 RepID=A0A9P7CTV8_9FUNG|nr:hypothetical protein G6F55_012307 [Rhizopus delemar]KAG1533501.1 hypothetical protein G6F51_012579 [Rhizopus arrhizus]KAG1490061.1 hypothetical protein G6F54_010995 [Rhizopus delemar]KAG1507031.1 hypothetical protein G6F52_011738 [Rhizopus delemar]KAG1518711.1 hypothetical protein G6F53_000382 [Rhizopus delemar]
MSSVHKLTDSEESDSSEIPLDSLKKRKRLEDDEKSSLVENEAPLNLDRQCGVLIPPTNEPCTRAITCKIHSVGAKRAVTGRSQSFNDLIAVYQKKGIGRPQVPDKEDQLKVMLEESSSAGNHVSELNHPEEAGTAVDDVDSDEETQTISAILKGMKPKPLGERQVFYVQRRRKYFKIRDILLEAMTPKSSQCQIPHMDI